MDRKFLEEKHLENITAITKVTASFDGFIKIFSKHEAEDCKRFDKIEKTLEEIKRICYGVGGVVIFVQFVLKISR